MENLCIIEASVPSGFEQTAKMEAMEKLGIDARFERGKIIFDIPFQDVEKIKTLQSVDNLYVVLKRYKYFSFGENLADALIKTTEIVPELDWAHGLRVWQKFITADIIPKSDPQLDWQTLMATANEKTKLAYPDGTRFIEKKKEKKESKREKRDRQKYEKAAEKEKNETTDINEDKNETKEPVDESNTNGNSPDKEAKADLEEAEQPERKKPRLDYDVTMPSFRATCYRTGRGHVFQSPQAAAVFGGAVQDYFGWNVKMKDFDIEVVLDICEDEVTTLIALTKSSMHRRNISHFGPTTLRPTIAYGMLRLCKIQEGDIVCDPMCGGGSIPVEATINWPSAKHVCGDFDEKAITRCQANFSDLNTRRGHIGLSPVDVTCDVFRWDATQLPLNDNSVDVFVSDMPFGKRSGSKLRNWHLYPKTLADLARVSKLGSGRACLLTQDRKCMLKSLSSVKSFWTLLSTVFVNIGGLSAGVYILNRTKEVYKVQEGAAAAAATTEQEAQVAGAQTGGAAVVKDNGDS